MNTLAPSATLQQIGVTLGSAGLMTGFIVALGVLSGDAQGRVNLLYLLTLFAFIPVTGLLLSGLFMVRQTGKGLSGWVLDLPVWPRRFRHELLTLGSVQSRKFWLFYQTQLLTLGFGGGGLLAFVLLLLGSDISFVWRSTVLEATDLLPVLKALALPWWFWVDAQPQLELLQHSQDFRLDTPQYTAAELGHWWKYALAAQCSYNLLPRAIMLMIARNRLAYSQRRDTAAAMKSSVTHTNRNRLPVAGDLAPLSHSVPEPFVLLNWAGLTTTLLDRLQPILGVADQCLAAGPLLAQHAALTGQNCIVLVKAWEPPMGELSDYLATLQCGPSNPGLLLPLDWESDQFLPVSEANIMEWRRFCSGLANWSVLQPVKGESW